MELKILGSPQNINKDTQGSKHPHKLPPPLFPVDTHVPYKARFTEWEESSRGNSDSLPTISWLWLKQHNLTHSSSIMCPNAYMLGGVGLGIWGWASWAVHGLVHGRVQNNEVIFLVVISHNDNEKLSKSLIMIVINLDSGAWVGAWRGAWVVVVVMWIMWWVWWCGGWCWGGWDKQSFKIIFGTQLLKHCVITWYKLHVI